VPNTIQKLLVARDSCKSLVIAATLFAARLILRVLVEKRRENFEALQTRCDQFRQDVVGKHQQWAAGFVDACPIAKNRPGRWQVEEDGP
jgi:hypothetical protein